MKTKIVILIISLGFMRLGLAQGFVNLGFEASTLPTNAFAFVSVSLAFPGWSVYRGGIAQSQVPYNTVYPGESSLSLYSRFVSFPPNSGNYNAAINLSPSDSLDLALGQTGLVPSGMNSLRFTTSGNQVPAGGLEVSFGGVPLSLQPVGFAPGYTYWAADISAFAGTVGELRFTANHSVGAWAALFDDITFSTSPVPEPSTWALLALGTALFAGAARCRRHR